MDSFTDSYMHHPASIKMQISVNGYIGSDISRDTSFLIGNVVSMLFYLQKILLCERIIIRNILASLGNFKNKIDSNYRMRTRDIKSLEQVVNYSHRYIWINTLQW